MVSTLNVLMTAVVLAAAACYWVVGVGVVKSARVNAGWMGWRDRLGLILAFAAAPVVAPVVGLAALVVWIDEERPALSRGAAADTDRDQALSATPPLLSGKRQARSFDLSLDSAGQV